MSGDSIVQVCDRAESELLVREEQIATLIVSLGSDSVRIPWQPLPGPRVGIHGNCGSVSVCVCVQRQVEASDDLVLEKEMECQRLQTRLQSLVATWSVSEVGVQTDNPSTEKQSSSGSELGVNGGVLSPVNRDLARVKVSSPVAVADHLDSSLESEMKVVGVDVADPYDSSECVGFSDTNLDDTQDSIHSVDSVQNDREVVIEVISLPLSPCPQPSLLVNGLALPDPTTEKLSRVEEAKVKKEAVKVEREDIGDEGVSFDF